MTWKFRLCSLVSIEIRILVDESVPKLICYKNYWSAESLSPRVVSSNPLTDTQLEIVDHTPGNRFVVTEGSLTGIHPEFLDHTPGDRFVVTEGS